MAATKIRDLAVKVSEYTDGQGQTKGRYENVGSMMKGEDGGVFLIFKRTFNPAGVSNPDGRDSIMISCFELRDEAQKAQQRQAPPPAKSQPKPDAVDDFEDDIPFS
jgi:hypothetical protein